MSELLILGAVAYDDKVVTIWEGFKSYFLRHGLDFDFILFSNYERQVQMQFANQVHVAWNSPLAWIQSQRIAAAVGREAHAICMRDTDRDLTSIILVRSDSPIRSVGELKNKKVAVGAADSPQATLIPLQLLNEQGLVPNVDFDVLGFDRLIGKHGDHIGGERDAALALMRGEMDAACMIDANHLLFMQEGTLQPGTTRVLARTAPFDHCNLTVLDSAPARLVDRFRDLLLGMSYGDPEVRRLLELEGLKQWLPGRTTGYSALNKAVDTLGVIGPFVTKVAAACA